MSKTTATLFLGLTFGLLGVLAYHRLQERLVEADAEELLNRICGHLKDLEAAKRSDDFAEPEI